MVGNARAVLTGLRSRMGMLFSTQETQGVKRNLAAAFLAQGTGLLVSILMSLVSPKILGVDEYAYWQLFLLYANYVGLLLFGVNDGLYLRLGGKRFNELDKGELKSQLMLVGVCQLVPSALVVAACFCLGIGGERLSVFIAVAVFSFFANLFSTCGYVFQATNLTRLYSNACFVNKAFFLLLFALAIACNGCSYSVFFGIYIVCQVVSLIFLLIPLRGILLSGIKFKVGKAVELCRTDIASGIKVTIAYYAGALILGFARMMSDARWGLSAFGLLSFSFSIMTFILAFVGQVAMVLFPVFRRMDEGNRAYRFVQLRSVLVVMLPFVYLAYYPLCGILSTWLPDYTTSLVYLGLILPICVFDSKMNLLCTTFLKVYRDERFLLRFNLIAMGASIVLSAVSAYLIDSIELTALSVVIAIALRSIISECYLARARVFCSCGSLLFSEVLLAASFVCANQLIPAYSWLITAIAFTAYMFFNRGSVRACVEMARQTEGTSKA